mmetsp:Transcript_11740/g.28478  ORF Transcript_11740/g.28478 Transcript_11740/m.28478 type:complete len:220 (-) Transcript_11740:2464-3123(-)
MTAAPAVTTTANRAAPVAGHRVSRAAHKAVPAVRHRLLRAAPTPAQVLTPIARAPSLGVPRAASVARSAASVASSAATRARSSAATGSSRRCSTTHPAPPLPRPRRPPHALRSASPAPAPPAVPGTCTTPALAARPSKEASPISSAHTWVRQVLSLAPAPEKRRRARRRSAPSWGACAPRRQATTAGRPTGGGWRSARATPRSSAACTCGARTRATCGA